MKAKPKRDSMEDEEKADTFILQDAQKPQASESIRVKDEMMSWDNNKYRHCHIFHPCFRKKRLT